MIDYDGFGHFAYTHCDEEDIKRRHERLEALARADVASNVTMLKPDKVREANGVRINEKIIPQGTKWTDDEKAKNAGFYGAGDWYVSQYMLDGPTHITIHNTEDIVSVTDDMAEQYTRATWPNQNMGSVRVHYYVDKNGAWQNLEENVVGWHSQDGNTGPGNGGTIAIEIIEDDGKKIDDIANDPQSEENGARLAAYLLNKYKLGIDKLTTHYRWSPTKKYCPVVLLPKWDTFVAKVQEYM
jgi:hypothetical protein